MKKIAFIGDIIGKPGRDMLKAHLKIIRETHNIDIVVANGENISHGFGFIPKNIDELLSYGVDVITGGNHTWDKKEGVAMLNVEHTPIIRPLNYPDGVPGKGYEVIEKDGEKIVVVNLMGHYGMPQVDNVFICAKNIVEQLKRDGYKNIFIDFHAETTSEKRAMMMLLQGNITVLVGTHTHVGTDDLTIARGTAYVTDIGLSGCRDNVIGMDSASPLKRFLTGLPARFDVPDKCKKILQIIVVEFEEGKAINAYKLKALDGAEPYISMEAICE